MAIMATPTTCAVCGPSKFNVSMMKKAATCMTAALMVDTATPINKNKRIRLSEIFRLGRVPVAPAGRWRSGKNKAIATAPPSANIARAKNGANR